MEKKPQILMIHGGMTFKSEKDYLHWLKNKNVSTKKRPYWEADLEEKLDNKFEIVRPRMPLQDNANTEIGKFFLRGICPFSGTILFSLALLSVEFFLQNIYPNTSCQKKHYQCISFVRPLMELYLQRIWSAVLNSKPIYLWLKEIVRISTFFFRKTMMSCPSLTLRNIERN